MSCDRYREALSARLDGEEPGLPGELLDLHLAGCPGCSAWEADAQRATRMVRLGPAEPVPDLTAAVLAAAGGARRRMRPGELLLRAGLLVVAVAQLTVVAWPSLLGEDQMVHSMHGAHETGVWNAALAVALAWAAGRPRHAAGLLPLLSAFAVGILGMSAFDLADGYVNAARVSTHLLVLTGLGLVAALAWLRREGGPRPAGRGGGLLHRRASLLEDAAQTYVAGGPSGVVAKKDAA